MDWIVLERPEGETVAGAATCTEGQRVGGCVSLRQRRGYYGWCGSHQSDLASERPLQNDVPSSSHEETSYPTAPRSQRSKDSRITGLR